MILQFLVLSLMALVVLNHCLSEENNIKQSWILNNKQRICFKYVFTRKAYNFEYVYYVFQFYIGLMFLFKKVV